MQGVYKSNPSLAISGDYGQVLSFCERRKVLTYPQFDASILKEVNLFSLPEDFDFAALGETLDRIIATLPAIKRIFADPITRITAVPEILPVESVRAINNQTVVHATAHSELWENITSSGLKPRKLLSFDNRDNYAIYENVVFARTVDMILSFVRKNISFLNDILYSNRDLQFNLLERENHLSYFLALGKLHTGYVRDYAKYASKAEGCMDRLLFIDGVLRARLGRPVYKLCKKHTGKLTLKKTNIFKGHKDYKKIYGLLKWFGETEFSSELSAGAGPLSEDSYTVFCGLLTIFAAGHFNFTFSDKPIDLKRVDASAEFSGWRLGIRRLDRAGASALLLTVEKDVAYRVLILPVSDTEKGLEKLRELRKEVPAEEYILASPMADERSPVVLSIYDIDSFRRLQQVLLRGMIESDFGRKICPFCGEKLEAGSEGFECISCRTVIAQRNCPTENRPYFVTFIKNFSLKKETEFEFARRQRLSFDKAAAAKMHFRNITPITADGDLICPCCQKTHQNIYDDPSRI